MKRALPAHCYQKPQGVYFQRRGWQTVRIRAEPGTADFARDDAEICSPQSFGFAEHRTISGTGHKRFSKLVDCFHCIKCLCSTQWKTILSLLCLPFHHAGKALETNRFLRFRLVESHRQSGPFGHRMSAQSHNSRHRRPCRFLWRR